MPPIREGSPPLRRRKVRKPRKASPRPVYEGPTKATKKVPAKPKYKVKAPKTQPGPYRESERKKVERNRSKPKYQTAIREARKHGPATRRGTSPAGDSKADAEFEKAKAYVRRQYARQGGLRLEKDKDSTVPPDVAKRVGLRKLQVKSQKRSAAKAAPVLKALEQTTRPLHGVAAGTRAAIKGKNVPKAVGRGLANKEKTTFSDVLKDVGAPKAVRSVGGFVLDVGLDPTTYVTGGTGAVAKKAALSAATKAESKALKAGLSAEQAKRFGERAARQATKTAPEGRGVTVRFAGKEARGVRRATAKVGRGVKRATDKPAPVRKVKEKARHLVADVNPSITPDNISREAYREVKRATRTARSSTARQVAKSKERAAAVKKAAKDADQEILDAIESGTLKHLSPEKRAVAKRLQDQFKYARRLERRAGIPVKEREGYVPHALKEPLEKGEGIKSVGAKVIRPSFAKARKEQRTLAEIRKTEPGKYSEDAALLYANRMIESHIASNKATLNRRLLDMGRRVRRGDDVEIGEGEKVFNVKGSNIREVDERRELERFLIDGDGGRGGQYVILNEQTVNRAVKNVIPQAERTAAGRAFDRVQGGWKWLATVPNVGFHVRNLVGDAQNAFLAENAGKLAVNTGRAARTLKRVGREEEALRRNLPGTSATLKGKGVKVGGKKVSYNDLIREAESVGAIRAGFINRELPELTSGKQGVKKLRPSGGKGGRSVKRFIQNREDLFRLATYIGGRNRGLSPEKAAERASKHHFDYADLTQLERTVLRRVAPFYTFSARNIPLQLTSYFTRPGKFAAYQKVRENFAKAFGIDLDENENNLTEFEQRSAPVPIKWKGEEFTLSFGPSGLPLTDLNELPMGNPTQAADEWFQRAVSLMSPGIKTPLELGMNYSFFFRDQLERDEGPLVPAPSFVANMPKGLRNKLGIVPDFVDKRTGKKGWGWPAKVDYVANLFPGPFGVGKRLATESDRPGEDTRSKLIGAAGLRIRKVDAPSAAISRLYDEKTKLSKKRSALNQRGINAENPTPAWRKLSDQIRSLEKQIEAQRHKRGDKIVPSRGRPKVKIVPGVSSTIDLVGGGGDIELVP